MTINVTWHLILVIVISIILIIGVIKNEEGLDFSSFIYAFLLVVLLGIYGGIFLW